MTTRRFVASAALCTCAIATVGCAAGGLAAVSPVLSALQIVSDRSVERTIAADLHTALGVTDEALVRMAIAVDSPSRVDDGWVVRGTSQGLSVEARLTPATERLTRIAVRVEAGRLTADKQTGEELHNQIARVLTERLEASRPPTPVQNDALASLEAQVRSLRMELAHQREASVPPATKAAPEPKPAMTLDTSAIISVPASYGFPATPTAWANEAKPASTVRGVREVSAPSPAPLSIRPTALEPARTLTAVPALRSGDE